MWTDVVFVRSIPDVTEHIPTLLEQWFANEVRRPQGFREGTSKGPRVPQRHSPPPSYHIMPATPKTVALPHDMYV